MVADTSSAHPALTGSICRCTALTSICGYCSSTPRQQSTAWYRGMRYSVCVCVNFTPGMRARGERKRVFQECPQKKEDHNLLQKFRARGREQDGDVGVEECKQVTVTTHVQQPTLALLDRARRTPCHILVGLCRGHLRLHHVAHPRLECLLCREGIFSRLR